VVLAVYGILRFEDLFHRGALKLVLQPSYETWLFLLEISMAIVAPLVLLSIKKVRETPTGLYISAILVVLGFITNRLNVSITGMETSAGLRYVPKWTEYGITAAIVAAGFALFGLAVKYLPIFPEEKEHEKAVEPATAEVAALSHAGD